MKSTTNSAGHGRGTTGYSIEILLFLVALFFSAPLFAQQGTNDPTFNPADIGSPFGANDRVIAAAIQTDGKIIIGGLFTTFNGITANRIARLNTNGSLDLTFITGTGANGLVWYTIIQPDGKILIAGEFTSYNGVSRNGLARLNTNGSLDTGFDIGTGFDGQVLSLSLQTDNRIVAGGAFNTFNGVASNRLVRLNPDGSRDAGFNVGTGSNNSIFTTALQADGKIIAGGLFTTFNGSARNRIARLNADGSVDLGFVPASGANDQVRISVVQADGKILVGGRFTSYDTQSRNRIARINADGTLDTSFDPGTGFDDQVETIALQSDGKAVIGGVIQFFNGVSKNGIVRLNTNGSLDAAFDTGTGTNNAVDICRIQSDGKVIMGGGFSNYNGTTRNQIARLNSDASNDFGFNAGSGSGANDLLRAIALQSNSQIIIGGAFTTYNGVNRNRIARLQPDGNLDLTFDPGSGANGVVRSLLVQPDNKVIIGGEFLLMNGQSRSRIARLLSDGSVDPTFVPGVGANSTVHASALQSDGKILLGGDFTTYNGTARNRICRINADGSHDATFNPGTGANGTVLTCTLQADGKIVISGSFTTYNGVARNYIARLNPDGSLDATFSPTSGANDWIRTHLIQLDGKIFIGGDFSQFNGVGRTRVARVNTDGSLDTGFNPGTGVQANPVLTCSLQLDGKIFIGGDFTSYNGVARQFVARLNSDGSLDTSFDPALGGNSWIRTSQIQLDGKILIGGNFTSYGGTLRTRVARIQAQPVNLLPIVGDSTACPNAVLTLTASGAATNQQYRWYDMASGGTLLSSAATFTTPALSSTTAFYVAFFNPNIPLEGPRQAVNIDVGTGPAAPVASNTTATCGQSVTLTASGGSDGQYRWFSEAAGSIPIAGNFNSSLSTGPLTSDTTFYVAVNNGTCDSDRTPVVVTVSPCGAGLTVFNAISPNDDELNKALIVLNIEGPQTKSNHLTILDRWGNIVFEATDYDNQSNAFTGLSSSGAELASGIYYYKLEFNSGFPTQTGFISLRK